MQRVLPTMLLLGALACGDLPFWAAGEAVGAGDAGSWPPPDAGSWPPPDAGSWSPADAGLARHPTRSGTMALSGGGGAGARLLVVNPDLPALVTFDVTFGWSMSRFELFPQGSGPSSVAAPPAGTTAVVTLRRTGELAMVSGLPVNPRLDWRLQVCAEPAGVALGPEGRTAVVACLGEAVAVVVDTRTRAVRRIPLPGVSRAVAISDPGSGTDQGLLAYLPLFFGRPVEEGTDTGRVGQVEELDLDRGVISREFALQPVPVSGPFAPAVGRCAPNQLGAIALLGDRVFVPHVCASPDGQGAHLGRLFAGLSVVDLTAGQEQTGPGGSAVLIGFAPFGGLSRVANPVDVEVEQLPPRLHVLSQGADAVLTLDASPGVPFSGGFPLRPVHPLTGPEVPALDRGRAEGWEFRLPWVFPRPVTGSAPPELEGLFRTRSLRNVAVTGPYFHAGQLETLDAVVRFYDRGGDRTGAGRPSEYLVPLGLSDDEQGDLVAFLGALTSPLPPPGYLCDRAVPVAGEQVEPPLTACPGAP